MLSYLTAIGPIILTLMGAILATRLFDARKQRRWRLAFFVFGFITALGIVYSASQQSAALKRIEEAARGGDAPYFVTQLGDVQPDGLTILAVNRSKYPIFDVFLRIRSHVDEPAYDTKEPEQIEVGTIPPGVKEMKFRLPFGYYQIDIRTRYNKYTEMLKLMPFNGQIGQSYSVTDGGRGYMIAKATHPDGFPGTYAR
jgi:hypothetical protein